MKFNRFCRTVFFTPGLAQDRYRKARSYGADICLVDLEDSVGAPHRDQARAHAEKFFSDQGSSAARLGVRINAVDTTDGMKDLLAIRGYDVLPAVILVPMVESPRDLEVVQRVLHDVGPGIEYIAMIETPRAVENATAIALSDTNLRALLFGSADLTLLTGAERTHDALAYARSRVVNAAHAANIYAIDTPWFDTVDVEGLRHESEYAKSLGFGGKAVIHPRQVPIVNATFSPDEETLEKARKIVARAESGEGNIAVVDGQMVGAPFFEASKQLVDQFGRTDRLPAPTGR